MRHSAFLRAHRAQLSVVLSLALAAAVGCTPGGDAGLNAQAKGQNGAQAQREIISTVTGDSPNFAQLANGDMMTVVSRDFGRGAKAGALVELYYPRLATDHLWDSYAGVSVDGKLSWAHELRLVGQSIAPDTGRVISTFEGPAFGLVIEDVLAPERDVHLRRVTVVNRGGGVLKDASVAFYGFFTLGMLPGGDRVRFDAQSKTLLQTDNQMAVAIAAFPPATDGRVGLANLPVGDARDARLAAEKGQWDGPQEAGPLPTGVNGVMRHVIGDLLPGRSASVTYAIGAAPAADRALSQVQASLTAGWPAAVSSDEARWAAWLARARMPVGLGAKEQAVYRRALITLAQHRTRDGAIIAAPTNLNPPYRFIWPRDGTLIALAMMEAGYVPEAAGFMEFLEKLQQPSGGFAINYFPDASRPLWDFGTNGNEHDQVGTFAWGVERVFARTGDRPWLAARWPAVRKACDFLLAVQQPDGLLGTCRDLWELDHDGTWTYSNAAGWAGLAAGVAIAERMGAPADAARYKEGARRLHDAMSAQLAPEGFFVRGIRKGKADGKIEAANLALGTRWFGAFPDRDLRMAMTGDRVERLLSSNGGGVRRYEGDRYYDGQPWPVATSWLALHKLERGDRASAERLLGVMTRTAGATDALMLGEQFDEAKGRWVSAFPLAWSEASYVRLALALSEGR